MHISASDFGIFRARYLVHFAIKVYHVLKQMFWSQGLFTLPKLKWVCFFYYC